MGGWGSCSSEEGVGRKGSQEMMTKPGKTTDGNTGMLFSDAIADVKQPANKSEDGCLPQGKWGGGMDMGDRSLMLSFFPEQIL